MKWHIFHKWQMIDYDEITLTIDKVYWKTVICVKGYECATCSQRKVSWPRVPEIFGFGFKCNDRPVYVRWAMDFIKQKQR